MDKRLGKVEELISRLYEKEKEMTIHQWERLVYQKLKEVDQSNLPSESKIAVKYAIYTTAITVEALVEALSKNKINGMADLKLIIDQRIREAEEVLVEDY